jgi:hypothetical protein
MSEAEFVSCFQQLTREMGGGAERTRQRCLRARLIVSDEIHYRTVPLTAGADHPHVCRCEVR